MPESRPPKNDSNNSDEKQNGHYSKFLKDYKKHQDICSDEQVTFNGVKKTRGEVQRELNSLSCAERVIGLTSHRRDEITKKLREFRKSENLKDGKCVYEEYKEIFNDDFDTEDSDFIEAWWISAKYLKELHERKVESDFWEESK